MVCLHKKVSLCQATPLSANPISLSRKFLRGSRGSFLKKAPPWASLASLAFLRVPHDKFFQKNGKIFKKGVDKKALVVYNSAHKGKGVLE